MQVVILSARTGWHTDELCRALVERGHSGRVASYEAMVAVRAMGEVVVKPIFGSMGHGMVRVSDPEVAFRIVRPLEQMRAVFYIQRVVDHGGRDVRVFIVGGRVLGAIERRAAPGEWR